MIVPIMMTMAIGLMMTGGRMNNQCAQMFLRWL